MKQHEYTIIVAGGKGTRMQAETAKQFLLLNGLPVIMHTINAFYQYSKHIKVVLVLPKDDMDTWEKLCDKHSFSKKITTVSGGASRFQSVKNGLNIIPGTSGLVAIHDGVRPLIDANTIGASFRIAAVHQTAVAAVRLKESIRMTDQDTTMAVDRSGYRLIQTPQTFNLALIKAAYNLPEEASMTDDASVAEKAGHKISLFEGSYANIKITTPEDMVIAETLMNSRANHPR